MDRSLIGAIAAGVVCGVLFIITLAIICYLVYRCRRYEDEKSSQHAHLMNGHVANGGIPTVAALVPVPSSSSQRQIYQFPTMPVRHMASYRPRYIEERNPTGLPNGVRSHTYSGAYTAAKGPVVYDVRQHTGYRANREPLFPQRTQEESVATMTLGEESPKSERHFVLEENNNNNNKEKIGSSVKRATSIKSNTEYSSGNRSSFRVSDIRIPSPDAQRRSYLFSAEPDRQSLVASSTNENTPDTNTLPTESANQRVENVLRESRRQRKGDEGAIDGDPPPARTSSRRHVPARQEPITAVYIPNANPDLIPEEAPAESDQYIERYFINDDAYTVTTHPSVNDNKRSSQISDNLNKRDSQISDNLNKRDSQISDNVNKRDSQISDSHALRVFGRPVGEPDVEGTPSFNFDAGFIGKQADPAVGPVKSSVEPDKDAHHVDYRVIKSKRRPSWLQNAGQWFAKKRNK